MPLILGIYPRDVVCMFAKFVDTKLLIKALLGIIKKT